MPRLIGLFLTAIAIAVISIGTNSPSPLFAQIKKEAPQKVEVKKDALKTTPAEPKKETKKEEPKEVPLRRSADGFPIPTGAIHRFGNRQMRHADGITAAVVSPDGKFLATRGQQTVVVWDLQTLNAKQVFNETEGGYSYYSVAGGLAFTPDSKGLLMTSSRSNIRTSRNGSVDVAALYDLETGKKKFGIQGGSGYQSAIWVSNQGKEIGTFTDYQVIRYHNATDGKALTTTTLSEPMFQRIFLSPSGDLIGGLNNLEVLKVFETRGGKEKYSLEKVENIVQLTIGADNKTLIYQDGEGKVHVHDMEKRKELFTFKHPADKQAGPMQLSQDGNTLFFGGTQGQLYRWDIKENKRLADVGQHSTWTLQAIALSPDEKMFYSTGWDRLVRRWDLATGKELPVPDGYITHTTLVLEPDRKHVIISDHVGRVDRWNLETGKLIKQFHPGRVDGNNHVTLSHDGRWLAAGCTTQTVKVWDLEKEFKDPIRVELGAGEKKSGIDHVQRVAFSPDAKLLYCNTELTGLSALELPSGKTVWNVEKPGYRFSLDPTGKWIVSGSGNYTPGPVRLKVIEAKTGKLAREIEVEPLTPAPNGNAPTAWVSDFTFMPQGDTILSVHYDGSLRLFDVESGQERKRIISSDRRSGLICACSPDGKWVALSGPDRRIRIVELAGGREAYSLGSHDAAVTQVAFTLDGRGILSSADLAPLLWDLKPANLPKLGTPDETWELLASEDAVKVYRLQWALMENAEFVEDLLAERVKPEEWYYDRKRYDQLVKNLDTPRFVVREGAQKEMMESVKIPLSWLRESFRTIESVECKDRLRRVIDFREKQPATREWRILRSIQILEKIADTRAKELLKKWSVASEGSVLATDARAALERLTKQ